MLLLLVSTCRLLLPHFLHCLVYSLPALIAFSCVIYLFINQAATLDIIAWVVGFLVLNALFIHAASRQMLKHYPGPIDFLGDMRMKRSYVDFFLLMTFSMSALAALGAYFIDVIHFLIGQIKTFEQAGIDFAAAGENNLVARSIKLLKGGAIILMVILVFILVKIWVYLCCTGIRISAFVEGYYLRSEEAISLTKYSKSSALLVSFLFIVAITTYVDIFTEGLSYSDGAWLIAASWAMGYFIITTAHIAMWTYLYQMNVTATGYHMTRVKV